jgi:putative heme d1 biosynthesis radical SAM protein NirJ2
MLVSWNTTNQCNLRCPHCYRDAGAAKANELNYEEGCLLLESVKSAGFHVVVFSGGEPLLRPDIYKLMSYARNLGLRPVCGSNGTLLTTETVQKLREAGAAMVGISLDSLDPRLHDRFRGVDGAWEATRQGMANCRAAGLPFQVHTTVFPWNYQEIEKISRFTVDIGGRGHHVFFFVPTGRGRMHETEIEPQQAEDLIVRLLELRCELPLDIKPTCAPQFMRVARQQAIPTLYKRGCLAGIAYCIIGTEGDVYPCPYMDLKVGNVRQEPFEQIWSENETLKRLRSQKYEGYCGICAYRRLCGGCRARSLAHTEGDYLRTDSSCQYGKQKVQSLAPLAEKLVVRLQQGLPLVSRPYRELASEFGVKESDIIRTLRWLKSEGLIKRLGASFDSHQLGYRSTLLAARVPEDRLDTVAAVINTYSGVTHNYRREHEYNLWFTLTAGNEQELDRIIKEIESKTGLSNIISFPARDVYKVAMKITEEELQGVFQGGNYSPAGLTK